MQIGKTLTACLIAGFAPAGAALINVAANGTGTTDQSTTGSGGAHARGIDGNTSGVWSNGSVTHTQGSATDQWWEVDLGVSTRIDSVDLWNRTDCCGGRLSDITVELFDSTGGLVSTIASDWNNNNSLGGGTGNYNVGPGPMVSFDGGGAIARRVRVTRQSLGGTNGNHSILSLAEVQVFSNNLAQDAIANGGSAAHIGGTHPAGPAGRAIDGNLGNFSHTNNTNGNGTTDGYVLDLGSPNMIDSIILHNRDSCCSGRFRDLTVELLAPDGNVLYTSSVLNPDNSLGGGAGNFGAGPATLSLDLLDELGSSVANVQSVRVTRAPGTGTGHDHHILSLGEIQVFGAVPEPSSAILLALSGLFLARRKRC